MSAFFAIVQNEIRRIVRNPFSLLALAVVVILPALYATLYLHSLWDPNQWMKDLPGALVIEDRGAGSSNYGLEAANQMRNGSGPHWIVMSRAQAEERLRHHKVAMLVRFPADFSEAIQSLSGSSPRAALIDVQVDQGGSYIVSQLGGQSLKTLQDEVANTVRQKFNRKVLFSINQAGDGLLLASQKAGLLADGVGKLSDGNRLIASKSGQAIAGINQLKGGMGQLDAGENRLVQGLMLAKDGSMRLADGLATMSEKVESAQRTPVMGWVLKKPLGFERLHDGLGLAASKTLELGNAHTKLAEGAQTIESGLKRSLEGTDKLEKGLVKLQDGLVRVSDGNQKASVGARQLSEKLGEASHKLSIRNPEALAEVASNPIHLNLRMVNPVPNYGAGFTPFFVPLVLWIGAIALFFMLDARDLKLNLTAASSLQIVLGRYAVFGSIGVMQALVLVFSLQGFLGLHPVHPVWFILLNLMLSLTFVAWVQVLIGLFNLAGRFAVLILLLLQITSSGGTFPLELCPPFFRAINPFLPLSYGVKMLRSILSGGLTTGQLQEGFGALGLMLVLALALMSVMLRRRAMLRELYEPSPVF